MIVLNKIARRCYDIAVKSGRVTRESGFRIFVVNINVFVNRIYEKTRYKETKLPQWSEYEFAAADAIIWLLAFLERLGCKNVEQLIKDVSDYREENPDNKNKDALFSK